MRRYFKYVKPYGKYFIFGPVFMLTEVLGEVLLPFFMSLMIKNGVGTGDMSYILSMGAFMILTTLLMMSGGIGGGYFNTKAANGFAYLLRKDAFQKVQEFSFANIDEFSTGSLVTRLTNDITQLQNVIRMALIMLLRSPGMLIGAIIMALTINSKLALVICAVVPVLGICLYLLITTAFPRFGVMQKKLDLVNSIIQETLTNVRVVKSFVRGEFEEVKFSRVNEELKETGLRAFRVVILMMPLMTLAMNATTVAVVWFGGNQIIVGDMDVADLMAFTTYIAQILISLMMLAIVLLQSSRALASAQRIKEVLDTEVDITDEAARYKELQVKEGRIEFRNVTFQYYKEREEKVLENISFVANPGEVIGIIGSTGSGKSSLVQLIPRLYDVTEGEVLVDGVNVKDYSLRNLREGVGMVLQKNVLFSGTIRDNLLWGDETACEEEIKRAAQGAQADDFVNSFVDGYETVLGQGGVNVSGGQKQRLCIARALLKKPKILILDDSTSAVDTATEAKIRKCFQGDLKSATKLIIAQRITSVMDATKILVMEEGQIIAFGTHEELLLSCDTYQEIYRSQMDADKEAVS